jgi:hypothetical protein
MRLNVLINIGIAPNARQGKQFADPTARELVVFLLQTNLLFERTEQHRSLRGRDVKA